MGYCTFIYLGPGSDGEQRLGLSIPSSAFGMEDGSVILPALYEAIYEKMSVATTESNVKVYFDGRINDTCISPGIYAKPFRLTEIGTTVSLDNLVSKERVDYKHDLDVRRMDPDILRTFMLRAYRIFKERKDRRTTPVKSSEWPRSPQPECLIDSLADSICRPEHTESALKCTRKLLAWISERQIVEFGQRNAERVLDKPLRGKSGKGGGVEDALRILIAGSFIQKCPSPSSGYKRPSPWYLVHPVVEADSDLKQNEPAV